MTPHERIDMGPGYRHVACCVEGSHAHKAVIAVGMRMLATNDDATLTLLHVVTQPIAMMATPVPDISGLFESAEHWLKDVVNETHNALRAAGSSAKVDGVLLEGHPGISVVSWAKESDVDLVVAASHRGHFDRALLGSFATYVAYHSPCDVHLVRPELADTATASAT
jgi:nucleotide-binding universal stress UspA family protein